MRRPSALPDDVRPVDPENIRDGVWYWFCARRDADVELAEALLRQCLGSELELERLRQHHPMAVFGQPNLRFLALALQSLGMLLTEYSYRRAQAYDSGNLRAA